MTNRAVRLTLVFLFVVAMGVCAYLLWTGEARARMQTDALAAYQHRAVTTARDVIDLRASQQAYVATGQGAQFWGDKVASALAGVRESLTALKGASLSLQAQSALDAALTYINDFEAMDGRAREYARGGQNLLASDIIFADGLQLTSAAVTSLDQALAGERETRAQRVAEVRRRQAFAVGSGAAAALLVVLLLVPQRRQEEIPLVGGPLRVTAPDARGVPDLGVALDEGWSRATVANRPGERTPPPPQPQAVEAAPAAPPAPLAPPPPSVDLAGLASVCTDLARLSDTHSLAAVLERAGAALNANGIVLWIADPDGRELSPIVTHGYTPHIVTRLGTIVRDAENATAAAFRTSLLQTVKTDTVSNGAIAAPLVTPGGCVGVMAAEVREKGEQDPAKLAAATIVAAQLATLVGPPSARPQARAEVAG
jgi:hypothetical protein